MKHFPLILSLLMLAGLSARGQELKVTESEDKNKVNRDAGNGTATIVFESSLKDLTIIDDMGDECLDVADNLRFYLIDPEPEEVVEELGYPRRTFILKTPKTSEYILETGEILPNTVTYFTVTMPNRFPLTLGAEYLFSKSARSGLRISFGKQFGGYASYKWGKYRPSGNNIDNVHTDVNLTNAEFLGYIRTSITAGARIGLLYRDIGKLGYGLYLLIGGGYGEYGRQWQNPTQVEGDIYFHTDYMKGFDGEIALQATVLDWLTLSGGIDMLFAKGKVSADYMIGVGINLNFTKMLKKKTTL